jgi:hypothetical protein
MTLILASSSAIRRAMLDQAGVAYSVVPPDVDEGPVQAAMRAATPSWHWLWLKPRPPRSAPAMVRIGLSAAIR